ncbi:MAG TPA: hypothetical protein VL119_08975 [Acidimicrobiia bacterium]|nr:hypothetical protein [Acidimicrobiia bacterium]
MRAPTRTARAVLVPYVVSRLVVVVALVTVRHVMTTQHFAMPVQTRDGLLSWDAAWYRDIAHAGYDGVAREGLRFFPLFPLLGRVVSWLPGATAGFGVVFVANASALVLGFALYQLAMHERADAELARRSVWLLYLVPPAFVLVMGYAEATFMTFAAITLLCLRTRRWWVAAVFGFLAGLTRPVGVLLAIPAAVEGWEKRDARAVAPVVAPVLGLFSYLIWAARRSHDFFYPLRAQQDPTRRGHWVDPVRAVAHNVRALFVGDHVSAGVHALSAVIFVGLLVVVIRRWPLSFALYAGVALVVALSSRNLDSLERYGLATVPFVLAGADVIAEPGRERVVLCLAAGGLVLASVLAFTGVLVP